MSSASFLVPKTILDAIIGDLSGPPFLPMASRFRQWIESIVYVGMRPGQPGRPVAPPDHYRWLGPLRGPVERFLSGGPAPSDPLYLTNRTVRQRVKSAAIIVIPFIFVAVFVGLAAGDYFKKKAPLQAPELTAAEIAAKSLPNFSTIKLDSNKDVEVLEIAVEHSPGTAIVATVKNHTSRTVHNIEIVVDLTDSSGSQLGGISMPMADLPPNGSAKLRFPITHNSAALAIVREIRSQ
jgi:hypothetical protein